MIAHVINTLLGIWLMASPAFLNIKGTAEDINHIFGPVIATFAITAWWEVTRNLRFVNIVIGIWLLIAPWILNYNDNTAILNSLVVGLAVSTISLVKGKIENEFGGGWKSLFD